MIGEEKEQVIQLNRADFERVGNRKSYAFNLMLKNGQADNDISGTVVARDLNDYLSDNKLFKELLDNKEVKINLDSKFMLHLKML